MLDHICLIYVFQENSGLQQFWSVKYIQRRKIKMASIIFLKPEICLFTSKGPKMYLSYIGLTPPSWPTINCKMLDYRSRDVFNFDFLEKGLGIVSPPHFVNDFSIKTFLVLYSMNWPNFIVDIKQYVHCNCLFPRFWRHLNFEVKTLFF